MAWILYAAEMLLAGVGVGMISGALGLGGGILMVPVFITIIPGMDAHTAKGTSLFIIIFVSLFNAWRLNRNLPQKPWRLAAWLALGSIFGSYAGAWITALLSEAAVLWIFMALLAGLAIRTFFLRPQVVHQEEVRRRRLVPIGIGVLAGMAGGATGTGGGLLLVPLALMTGIVANERVVGLSNLVMVATSIAGSIAHLQAAPKYTGGWTIGHVCLSMAPLVFIGAQFGSQWGTRCNSWLTLRRRRVVMGVLLLLIAARLLYRLLA